MRGVLAMTFDELFGVQAEGDDRWSAAAAPATDERRLFGGLLLGQAIVAASAGTRRCHALHALFVGPGATGVGFEIAVARVRDGGSFATRQVEIRQRERLLLVGLSSHHDGDEGPEHQVAMPELPPPEALEDGRVARLRGAEARGSTPRRYLSEEMLDARPVEMDPEREPGIEGRRAVWFRPRAPIRGERAVHQAAIAFASDMGLVHVGLQAHHRLGDGTPLQAASLDHSIRFHRDAAADDWMLHVQRAPVMANGRGLSHASVFSRDGRLVASVSQEFLARRKRD